MRLPNCAFFFVALLFWFFGYPCCPPPSIYQTRARRRMQPYIHLNFSISILDFEDFFFFFLDLSGVRICFWIGNCCYTCYLGLNLKSFSPAWLCRSGTPQRPNGAKSDTRSQICGWWLSYLCLFHLRSPKVVCVSEKGTHHLLTAAAVVSACVVLCVGGWVGGWVANNTEASVSQSISQHPPPAYY